MAESGAPPQPEYAARARLEPSRPSVQERKRRGKAARQCAPRSSHAEFQPAPDRRDPVDILEEQSAGRVQSLIPLRYGRMLRDPFAFYRGTAAVMAADLAGSPVGGIGAQICGDAHLSNFGLYGSPERNLMFDINDFDETLPGPWEWDVKRLAASFVLAARANGFGRSEQGDAAEAAVRGYREMMRRLAAGELKGLPAEFAAGFESVAERGRAQRRQPRRALERFRRDQRARANPDPGAAAHAHPADMDPA